MTDSTTMSDDTLAGQLCDLAEEMRLFADAEFYRHLDTTVEADSRVWSNGASFTARRYYGHLLDVLLTDAASSAEAIAAAKAVCG